MNYMDFAASTQVNLLYAARGFKIMSELTTDMSARVALEASAKRLLEQAHAETLAMVTAARKARLATETGKIRMKYDFARNPVLHEKP